MWQHLETVKQMPNLANRQEITKVTSDRTNARSGEQDLKYRHSFRNMKVVPRYNQLFYLRLTEHLILENTSAWPFPY